MKSELDELTIHGKLMKRGIRSNQNQVSWNYNQRDILLSDEENERLFRPKIGENEEHYELICKIKLLNLIKTQITS